MRAARLGKGKTPTVSFLTALKGHSVILTLNRMTVRIHQRLSEAVMTYDHDHDPHVSALVEFVTTAVFTVGTVFLILVVGL